MTDKTCTIDNCHKPVKSKGWCSMHLGRWMRHGDPHTKLNKHPETLPRGRTVQHRLMDRMTVCCGCWLWIGAKDRNGYGLFGGTTASRAAYEAFVGPVPDDLDVDHLCRQRDCINPAHLQLITHAENLRRRSLSPAEHLALGQTQRQDAP